MVQSTWEQQVTYDIYLVITNDIEPYETLQKRARLYYKIGKHRNWSIWQIIQALSGSLKEWYEIEVYDQLDVMKSPGKEVAIELIGSFPMSVWEEIARRFIEGVEETWPDIST